jgi:hypothetical protein
MTSTGHDIEHKIQKMVSFIETAERLIYEGKIVDIAALQGHMSDLCKELDRLPQTKAKSYLPHLQTLFETLERLEKDIDLQHNEITERLKFDQGRVNPLMAQEVNEDENDT